MPTTLMLKTREDLDEDFIQKFHGCARRARVAPYAASAPSEGYLRMLLELPRRSAFVLLSEGDEVLGRAAVFLSSTNADHASIGLYEISLSGDHQARSARLLAHCVAWAKTQQVKKIFGPMDASTFFNYRFRVDQDPKSFSWEPNHPPEYVQHWRDFGFTTFETYSTMALSDSPFLPLKLALPPFKPLEFFATMRGYTFHPFSSVWAENLDMLYEIGSQAFAQNLLYEPLDRPTFDKLYGGLKVDFSPSIVLRNPAGKTVGFALSYYDKDAIVVKTVGLLASERGKNLGFAIMTRAVLTGVRNNSKTAVSALTRSGNKPEKFIKAFRNAGIRSWAHFYELFELDIS